MSIIFYRISLFSNVSLKFKYVNEYYSIFELLFRFFFLVVAFLSLMILTIGLRKFLWVEWKSEQK